MVLVVASVGEASEAVVTLLVSVVLVKVLLAFVGKGLLLLALANVALVSVELVTMLVSVVLV
jgi:hypothetical protein